MIARGFRFLEQKYRLLVIGVLLLMLAGGVVYSIHLGDQIRFLPDESDYTVLAHNLLSRGFYSLDGIHPTAYRAPGYSFILALFSFLGLSVTGFRILNYGFLVFTLWLAGRMLAREAGKPAGTLAVFFLAAYGVLFYTAGTLYPQTLATLLLLLGLDRWTKSGAGPLDFGLGGLAFGGMILTVPTFAFIPLALGLWHLITRRKVAWFWAGMAVATLVVGAWLVRNALVFRAFVFVASNAGENLLLGNSENTTPNGGSNTDIQAYILEADRRQLNEIQRDRFYRQQALEYIQDHTLASLRMYLLKFVNYFNYRNQLVTASESSPAKDIIMLITYGPLICIYFLRWLLIKWYRPTPLEILFLGLYLLGGLIQALFFTRIRFRLPLDVLIIMSVTMLVSQGLIRGIRLKDATSPTVERIS